MRSRRIGIVAVCALVVLVGQAAPSGSATTFPATQCSAEDYNGDPRLGPRDLPTFGSVGFELRTYDRFAGLTPEQFLATYWDPVTGSYRFPPENGFLIGPDGQPVHAPTPLRAGQRVDRYGSEFGAFLAPIGTLYSQRSIPPQSLDNTANPGGCNYRAYVVLRELDVDGGPIAPAFGQPGHGVQYRLVSALVPGAPVQLNILWLVDHGFLRRCAVIASQPYTC